MQPLIDLSAGPADRPDLLSVSSHVDRGVLILTMTGEADIAGEQVLHEALDLAMAHAPGPVVVDLSGLTFCDVRSLTSLLASHAVALTRGAGVALAGMSEIMTRVWTLAFTAHGGQPDQYRTVAEAVDAAAVPHPV